MKSYSIFCGTTDAMAEARRLFLDADSERSSTHFEFLKSATLSTVEPVEPVMTESLYFGKGTWLVASYLPPAWSVMDHALPKQ